MPTSACSTSLVEERYHVRHARHPSQAGRGPRLQGRRPLDLRQRDCRDSGRTRRRRHRPYRGLQRLPPGGGLPQPSLHHRGARPVPGRRSRHRPGFPGAAGARRLAVPQGHGGHLLLPGDLRGGRFPPRPGGGQVCRRAGGGVPGPGHRPAEIHHSVSAGGSFEGGRHLRPGHLRAKRRQGAPQGGHGAGEGLLVRPLRSGGGDCGERRPLSGGRGRGAEDRLFPGSEVQPAGHPAPGPRRPGAGLLHPHRGLRPQRCQGRRGGGAGGGRLGAGGGPGHAECRPQRHVRPGTLCLPRRVRAAAGAGAEGREI